MPPTATTKERDVLSAHKTLLEFFKNRGFLDYWRMQTSGVLRGGKFMCPNKDTPGFSDIIILTPKPCVIFLELKAEKGRQSPAQKEFQRRVEAMNHKYYISRSVRDLCEILTSNGVPANLFVK